MVAAAVAAEVGALILGEYEFAGATPFIAGVLFGLAIGELMLTIAKSGTTRMAAVGATVSAGGVLWAAWISSGHGIAPIPGVAYVAVGLGAVVAGTWILAPSRRRQTADPDDPLPRGR